MARLNVETSLWADPRFQNLMLAVGDRHKAIGLVVDLWSVAQQFWCPDKQLIPLPLWESLKMPEAIVECGMAERRTNGIYARGSEKHFAWYFDRIESGRRGAAITNLKRWGKKDSNYSAHASADRQDSVGPPTAQRGKSSLLVSESQQMSASSSFSSSKRKRLIDPSDSTRLWNYYSDELEKKGLQPVHDGGKTGKILERLLKHGFETAQKLIDAFLSDNDQFVQQQSWSIGLLASQQQKYINKIKLTFQPRLLTPEEVENLAKGGSS